MFRKAVARTICFSLSTAAVIGALAAPRHITTTRKAVDKPSYKPAAGYVPDKVTAIRIAVAVWIPIYGMKEIESERPYSATLKNGVWTVTGSLKKGWFGGVAEADISKRDGKTLRVIHGK